MKALKIIVLTVLISAASFFGADYLLRYTISSEGVLVVHKTFSADKASLNYHPVKNRAESIYYVLVCVQTNRMKGYFISVPKEYFLDVQEGDVLPMDKEYGYFTGWEYRRELIIN